MLSYLSATNDEGITFNGWIFKTVGGDTFVALTDVCNFFNIPEEEAAVFIEKTNVRNWNTLTSDDPPPRLFQVDTKFINENGLFQVDVTNKAPERVLWLSDLIFKKNVRRPGASDINKVFDDLKKIFIESKTPGVGTAFMPVAIVNVINRFAKIGEEVEWVRNFLQDMLSSTYDTIHNIFEKYGNRLEEYNGSVVTLRLLMFLFGEFKLPLGAESKSGNSRLVSVIKYTYPIESPFYALTMKYFMSYVKNKQTSKRPSPEQVVKLKLEALTLMRAFNRNVPPREQLLKFGDEASLSGDNAGPAFKRTVDALASHTQLFLELANRDYSGFASVFAKISPQYD